MMKCEVSFCNRIAAVKATHAGIEVCKTHYQQDHKGKEFTPIKPYRELPRDAEGRVCTDCERYKPWDEFYKRSGPGYWSKCKDCTAVQHQERKQQLTK